MLLTIAAPAAGFGQTGFYLTFPCKGGDNNLKRFDPKNANICIVASPILALADIASISEVKSNDGNPMFEMKLTREGHARLKTAIRLSPAVAFIVDKEILFLIDTEKNELHETIRVYQATNLFNFYRLHEILLNEKLQG